MDVIRFVLSEDDVKKVGIDVMCSLAQCSTSQVMREIKLYLNRIDADPEVKEIVGVAFRDELAEQEKENDAELLAAINMITGIRYQDISAVTSLEELLEWNKAIELINSHPMLRPYKPAIRLYTIKEIIETVTDMGLSGIAKKLYKGKGVFSEGSTARAVGTPFKQAYYQSQTTEVKSRGIDFLIRMKKNNVAPLSWRFL